MSEPCSHISEEEVEVHRGVIVGSWASLSSLSLFPHLAVWLQDIWKVFSCGNAKAYDDLTVQDSVPTLSLVTK